MWIVREVDMRRIGLVTIIVSLLLMTAPASAADYVMMNKDGECVNRYYSEIPFHITIKSADTMLVTTGSNGFVITSYVPDAWEFVEIKLGPAFEDIGYTILKDVDSIAPDTFVVGFYDPAGVPSFDDELYFTLVVNTGWAFDEAICVDTTWVSPTHSWQWSGPLGMIVPGFLDVSHVPGSPHCIFLWEMPCIPPNFTVVPPDTGLHWLSGCGDLIFELHNSLVYDGIEPGLCNFRILGGPGAVTRTSCTTSVYVCPPQQAGTYPVWVEIDHCCNFDYCEFDVVFLEESRPDGDCNCDGGVDIDDVVYLIAYIFTGGYNPHANPDCTGEVDIDDVVYLIAYIFSGGPAPCG